MVRPHCRMSINRTTRSLMFKTDRRRVFVNPKKMMRGIEVRRLRRQPDPLLKKAPFNRIVREILLSEHTPVRRFASEGYEALRVEADNYAHTVMDLAALATAHRTHKTTIPEDIRLVVRIQQKRLKEMQMSQESDSE